LQVISLGGTLYAWGCTVAPVGGRPDSFMVKGTK